MCSLGQLARIGVAPPQVRVTGPRVVVPLLLGLAVTCIPERAPWPALLLHITPGSEQRRRPLCERRLVVPRSPPPEKGRYLQLVRQGGVARAVGLQPEAALPLLHLRFKLLQQLLQQEGLRVKEAAGTQQRPWWREPRQHQEGPRARPGPRHCIWEGSAPAPTGDACLSSSLQSRHLLPWHTQGENRYRPCDDETHAKSPPEPHFDQFSCWSRLVSKQHAHAPSLCQASR